MSFFRRKKHFSRFAEVSPEDIFLDSRNLPEFDTQQFEGRIERPIARRSVEILGIFFVIIGALFVGKLGILQVARGEAYLKRSENNSYNSEPLFAERGVIYDRNGELLAWNSLEEGASVPLRVYAPEGFSHLLGYVSYPKKDSSGYYWQLDYQGQAGVEKVYQDMLEGENGELLNEQNVKGETDADATLVAPVAGENVTLSIDARVQTELFKNIKTLAETAHYDGGAGVILDSETGDVIALTSYPEYDSNVLSKGSDRETIRGYEKNSRRPYLDRAIAGLYTPGSIVKPFLALAALHEKIISPTKQILSTGSISLQSPYDPNITYIYKDNKAHGWVDMRHALAVSSNVYFYTIGGGFGDQEGLGIARIETYADMFGLAEKTGIDMLGENKGTIPSPEWKARTFGGDIWRIGDTYHTSIGQYGFQVTPIEMARAIAAIANGGTMVTPHLLKNADLPALEKLPFTSEEYSVVREGMRMVVTDGTAQALKSLPFAIAAKSGTAQVGVSKSNVNAWLVGFFPYDHPRYSFAILMEHGPGGEAVVGASRAALPFFTWLAAEAPEYTK